MDQHPPPLNEVMIDCLKAHYNVEVNTLELLPLGADLNSSVYKVGTKEGPLYFVKQKRGEHSDIPLAVVELLHQAKIQEIIYPIKTIQGQLLQHAEGFSLMAYPFIEGQNGFSRSLTDEQWLKLARVLRRIHEIEVPTALRQGLRQETYSPKWRNRVHKFYQEIDTHHADHEIALNLLAFLKKNKTIIHTLLDHAEELAQTLSSLFVEPVLCHSDIHAGNILISENNDLYIVDWDEPMMAPKERDLMFIGGGVGNVWNKHQEEKIFYTGYGPTVVNMEMLSYYRCERIIEDIALYTEELLSSTANSANRARIYQHFMDLFEPNGVIDIALYGKGLFPAKTPRSLI